MTNNLQMKPRQFYIMLWDSESSLNLYLTSFFVFLDTTLIEVRALRYYYQVEVKVQVTQSASTDTQGELFVTAGWGCEFQLSSLYWHHSGKGKGHLINSHEEWQPRFTTWTYLTLLW